MKRITWVFALLGLMVSLVSCDQGTEMKREFVMAVDAPILLIQDKDGNNALDLKISRINPNVKYDHSLMIIFDNDTLNQRGWAHGTDYWYHQKYIEVPWRLDFPILAGLELDGKTYNGNKECVAQILGVMMYDSKSYEMDVVSPLNKCRWHLRLEYETHTMSSQKDYIIRRCWVDGKRMPDIRMDTEQRYTTYGIILPIDK